MKRLSVLLLGWALLGLAGAAQAEAVRSGLLHHVVVIWLKEPGSQAARHRYLEISRSMAKLPGVLSYSVGAPVPSSHQPVDSSYDLAIVAVFKDQKALDEYNANPQHAKAVEEMRPLVQKLVVYDFAELAP